MSPSEQDHQSKNGVEPADTADPEVVPMARRRQFSRAYKLRILAEVAQCQRGEVGALLRREGLYSSLLSKWRRRGTRVCCRHALVSGPRTRHGDHCQRYLPSQP
jgi:hypothetical protein